MQINLSPLDFLILALATWYLAYAITKTHGAFGMFAALRKHAPLGGLTTCIVCCAFWMALALWLVWQTPLQPVVYVAGLAGGAVMLGTYTGATQN